MAACVAGPARVLLLVNFSIIIGNPPDVQEASRANHCCSTTNELSWKYPVFHKVDQFVSSRIFPSVYLLLIACSLLSYYYMLLHNMHWSFNEVQVI